MAKVLGKVHRKNLWLPEEDNILRGCVEQKMPDKEIALLMPNRSLEAIRGRRHIIGAAFYKVDRYSDEEKAYIQEAFLNHVTIPQMAKHLGRTTGNLHQFIFHNGMHRDARKTILARKYGVDVLKVHDDPEQIKIIMETIKAKEHEAKKLRKQESIKAVLNEMLAKIANGVPRKEAFQEARLRGATLEEVGSSVGITRERVRQITDYIDTAHRLGAYQYRQTEPRDHVCVRCNRGFVVTRQGNFKYCPECQPVVALENYERNKERARRNARPWRGRNKEHLSAYHRKRYQAVKEANLLAKLGTLEPEALERILAQVKGGSGGTEGGSQDHN